MSVHTKRALLWITLAAISPFLLVTGIWCLFLLNTINPMQIAFVTTFEVENRTPEPVWVTPIGTLHSGRKAVLPQFVTPLPAIPAWKSRDLPIEPGAKRRIFYDWDDVNFSDILIRDSSGACFNLVVDPDPPTDGYYANKLSLYSIRNLEDLPQPATSVSAAIVPCRRSTAFWCLAIAGLVAPFLFYGLRRELRRTAMS